MLKSSLASETNILVSVKWGMDSNWMENVFFFPLFFFLKGIQCLPNLKSKVILSYMSTFFHATH